MATHLHQAVTQNLECPICFNRFSEPKQLACTHTYCKDCLLRLYECRPENANILLCPVCRKITTVKDGDVSTLQTNIPIKSLVEDVKNTCEKAKQSCTLCYSDDKMLAESYCQECEEYMCASCHQTHANWKKFSGHEVVILDDIISGKSSTQKRHKCTKHPSEEEEFICIDCKKCICFRCRVLDHDNKKTHHIVKVKEHERNHKKNIQSLQQQGDKKKTVINKHIEFVEKQQGKLNELLEQRTNEIDQAYEESVQQLKNRRDMLVNEYKRHIQVSYSKLESLKDADCKQITSISSASELVGNGMKIPLQDQVLTVHNTLCEELQGILGKDEQDYSLPRNLIKHAQQMTFHRNEDRNELNLGTIVIGKWVLRKDIAIPIGHTSMASMPDGKMAVGYIVPGGIQSFSVDGSQETVMRNVNILGVSFLSDGRYVVRDVVNAISLYTPRCERLDVRFDTLSDDKSGHGGLDVDKENNIYISYAEVKKIHVFRPTGGKAVREIICDGYKPLRIYALKSKIMVVSSPDTVRVVDESGAQKYDVTKDGVYAFPAVCRDNTILIAWVKHESGLVTIEKYSHELKYMTTLVEDYKIQNMIVSVGYLQEFVTGEIALCTPNRLYFFYKSVTQVTEGPTLRMVKVGENPANRCQ